MENNLVRLKFQQRLNKLSSRDSTGLDCWQEAELINKAQRQWSRRQLAGMNLRKEGDEQSTTLVDDLQVLLSPYELSLTNKGLFFEAPIPVNYLKFKKVNILISCKDCPQKKKIRADLAEEANIDDLLNDFNQRPSFQWGETFCTLAGDKVRIYTNGEFAVENAVLMYYRQPRQISFAGCKDHNDNFSDDVELEFKDDVIELIIDEAVKIAAGDIGDFNNMQRSSNQVETNN